MSVESARRIIKIAAGVGLSALLLEGGRRIRNRLSETRREKIDNFGIELNALVGAAYVEGEIDTFSKQIDIGDRYLNHALFSSLGKALHHERRYVDEALASYGVTRAVAYPLEGCPGLWVRRTDSGYRYRGPRYHVLGEKNLYEYDPKEFKSREASKAESLTFLSELGRTHP